MEILLLQDVPAVGKKNDLLMVGDGFALNYLLPNRYAVVATPLVRRNFGEAIRRRAEERETERQLKAGLASALSGKQITFTRKATKAGKLYGAISEQMIAEALKSQLSVEMPADAIDVSESIKKLGLFQVRVKIGQQRVPVTVNVKEELSPAAKKAAAEKAAKKQAKADGDDAKQKEKKPKAEKAEKKEE